MKLKKLGGMVAIAALAISACGPSTGSGGPANRTAASGGGVTCAQPDVCKNKVGSSTS